MDILCQYFEFMKNFTDFFIASLQTKYTLAIFNISHFLIVSCWQDKQFQY